MLIRKCIFLLMKNTNHHLSLSASHSLFCNSNIKDYWSQITIASIIIMEKFEMWELSKCDTEERNEQMLLEKWHPLTSAIQDCHKFVKKKKKKAIKQSVPVMHRDGVLWVSGSPSMVPGPSASASPRNLLEIYILSSHHRPTGLETLGTASSTCFQTHSGHCGTQVRELLLQMVKVSPSEEITSESWRKTRQ